MKYPSNMDQEIIELCDLINSYEGLQTFESCCGHGKIPGLGKSPSTPGAGRLTAHSTGRRNTG